MGTEEKNRQQDRVKKARGGFTSSIVTAINGGVDEEAILYLREGNQAYAGAGHSFSWPTLSRRRVQDHRGKDSKRQDPGQK